jgi:hypothetical protein
MKDALLIVGILLSLSIVIVPLFILVLRLVEHGGPSRKV